MTAATTTETELAALAALREAVGSENGPMERHGLRIFRLCEAMAAKRGVEIDREVAYVASILHDIGLYDSASQGGVYVTDGKEFAAEMLIDSDWSAERIGLCLDAIERHHELRSQWDAGNEVEFLRRADLIELSAGVIRFGLPRSRIKAIATEFPRKGLYREVGKMVAKALRERPSTVPRILLRGR